MVEIIAVIPIYHRLVDNAADAKPADRVGILPGQLLHLRQYVEVSAMENGYRRGTRGGLFRLNLRLHRRRCDLRFHLVSADVVHDSQPPVQPGRADAADDHRGRQ